MENSHPRFFGHLELLNIPEADNSGFVSDTDVIKAITVHYPDCQQIILWLPDHYRYYNDILIKDRLKSEIIYHNKIGDIVQGSVQIIIDSVFIYPGDFEIIISSSSGKLYHLYFRKYPEGIIPESNKQSTHIDVNTDKNPVVYRDGLGNEIPNEDLILRENVIASIFDKIFRRVSYVSYGREGEVVYREGDKTIRFYMEMGGGDCVFYLNIPDETEWEATTGFPLSSRGEIIQYVAESTLKDQAPSCKYRISPTEIAYYKK
jgi:hypothetical protein